MTQREAFEAWALRNTSLPSAHEMAWAAWQAALVRTQAEPVAGEWRFDIDESNLYHGDALVASLDNTECTNNSWREACRYGAEIAARMNATPQQVEPAKPDGWVSVVDRLPKPGQAVLASMLTPRMLRRTIRAHHSPLHTVDASNWEDEEAVDATEDGNAWEPEGWYEDPVIGEMLEFVGVSDGDVTHWMPLPAAPGSAG